MTMIGCFRHASTAHGYGDDLWATYGEIFNQRMNSPDPATGKAPVKKPPDDRHRALCRERAPDADHAWQLRARARSGIRITVSENCFTRNCVIGIKLSNKTARKLSRLSTIITPRKNQDGLFKVSPMYSFLCRSSNSLSPSLTSHRFQLLAPVLGGVLLGASPVYAQSPQDPWETFNRQVYRFNQMFDGYLVRPVAISYTRVMPEFAKRGVSNFFNNLDDINVLVNDVLQGKMHLAAEDSGRFVINSTAGLAGFIDVASHFGLYKHNEDFGQTLGQWGVGAGPYMVLPFLGTSTVRDTAALVPDNLLNPVFWEDNQSIRRGAYILDTIDTRLRYLAAETLIRGDEYSFARNAYLQRREYLVADGQIVDEFDDF